MAYSRELCEEAVAYAHEGHSAQDAMEQFHSFQSCYGTLVAGIYIVRS
ncbi:hypothetical protein KIM372_17620 [Bombiscardovia nodaiensis]|uniref:HEPN domain-containing protein n=1 Tax=Bombiscardovia nodaiensis TaxID=2932181 RepID=A0ABM8BAA6_9BIFI|nr:hypothetical protein KIM372_17620 [Bombiscardovia nodaiensis]